MRNVNEHYEEEYVYLGDVTHNAVLIAWGKFYFNSKWKLQADKEIHLFKGEAHRRTSIGTNCESYGTVTVEVFDDAGTIIRSVTTDKTFVWIDGLAANTEYNYRIIVPGAGDSKRLWAAGFLWSYDRSNKHLAPTEKTYTCKFRTFPDPDAHEALTFVVIGDTGTGNEIQRSVAKALETVIDERAIRVVLMVGDTVYNRASGGSGAADSDWLTTYFQPYRTIIDRIPFLPCMGNHDAKEGFFEGLFLGEKQADRQTLYDNMLVLPRFLNQLPPGREASLTPGLFYRLRFGADIEFICLDTSKEPSVTSKRMFEHDHHKDWVQHVLTTPLGTPRWRIPFSHHPPYCKGPRHDEDETRLRYEVISLCEENGIRAFFSGHEHNQQCIDSQDIQSPEADRNVRCFITGGAGGFRTEKPDKETDGYMHSWGGNDRGHFLIVTIDGDEMTIEPIGVKAGETSGQPLQLYKVNGEPLPAGSIFIKASN